MLEQIIMELTNQAERVHFRLMRTGEGDEEETLALKGQVEAYAQAIEIIRIFSKNYKDPSVLQNWVTLLPRRHQGVLLACVRGLDGAVKHAPEKPLVREMRGLILVPADERETFVRGAYMTWFNREWSDPAFKDLISALDSFPVHYIMHLVHAMQIIAYKHPEATVRQTYLARYYGIISKWHLNMEPEVVMDNRLTRERINDPDLTE